MLSILHVEDSEIDHELTKYQLLNQTNAIRITWIDSARKALEVVKTKVFDCILSDFQMPEMNGMEFLINLRDDGIETPFIFLTSQGNETIAAEALRYGADDYYDKDESFAHYHRIINSIRHLTEAYVNRQQHRRAQIALQEREAELRSIFRAAPTGIGVVVDRVITQVNDRFLEIIGYSFDELVGQNSRFLYPSDEEYNRVGEEKYRKIQESGTGTVTTRMQRKDGTVIDVLLSSTPWDINDLSKGVTFTALDISDQKRAENALRESEEKYKSLTENINVGVFRSSSDVEGHIIEANKATLELFGYESKEELMKVSASDLYADSSKRAQLRAKFAEKDHIRTIEILLKKKSGETFYGSVTATSIRDEKGDVIYHDGILEDITERKAAEERLRLTQFAIDRSSDAAFWMGSDARFIYVNNAACQSLGHSRDELLTMTVHDIDPNFLPEVWPRHWEDVKKRGSFTVESRHQTKNGHTFPVEVTVNYIEFEGREYNCAFVRDITNRKMAEKALLEIEERYREMIDEIKEK